MKKSNQPQIAVSANFNYTVTSMTDGHLVHAGQVKYDLTEGLLDKCVQSVKANGGHMVDLRDLSNLDDFVGDAAIDDLTFYLDEDEDADDLMVELEQTVPDVLQEAIFERVPAVTVTVNFYYHVASQEKCVAIETEIPRSQFNLMIKAVQEGATSFKDLEPYDPTIAHGIFHNTAEKAISLMEAGHEEDAPYFKELPWQAF